MFKRFTNRQLGLALAGLTVLYLGIVAFGGRTNRTFQKTLAAVDTAQVNKILISPPGKAPVELEKVSNSWRLKLSNGQTAPIQANGLKSALGSLSLLDATQLVSREEEDWGEYKVDTSGTQVQLFNADNKVLDVVLGSFTYRTAGMNYVRLAGEEETYLVEGYLEGNFNKEAKAWRENKVMDFTSSDVLGLGFARGDTSSYQLTKDSTQQWVMMGAETGLDQTEVSSYISSIYGLKGTEFVDRKPSTMSPAMQLSIQTSNKGIIEVKAFADTEHNYLIQSSQNPETYFSGKSEGLFDKIFVNRSKFFVKE